MLKRNSNICFEDEAVIGLNEDDYINISAHRKHGIISTSTINETICLAIHH